MFWDSCWNRVAGFGRVWGVVTVGGFGESCVVFLL